MKVLADRTSLIGPSLLLKLIVIVVQSNTHTETCIFPAFKPLKYPVTVGMNRPVSIRTVSCLLSHETCLNEVNNSSVILWLQRQLSMWCQFWCSRFAHDLWFPGATFYNRMLPLFLGQAPKWQSKHRRQDAWWRNSPLFSIFYLSGGLFSAHLEKDYNSVYKQSLRDTSVKQNFIWCPLMWIA